MEGEANQDSTEWISVVLEATRRRLRAAKAPADRFALLRELVRLSGSRLAFDQAQVVWPERDPAAARFNIHITPDGNAFRLSHSILLDEIDPHLAEAMYLDAQTRAAGRRAPPDAFLIRFSPHRGYRTEAQRTAARALATMPACGTLLVSMPTGGGKSLMFQLMAMQARLEDPHASVAVIVPTVALALDHERTLRSYPGLEASRALVGSMGEGERNAVRDAFRRGEIPILLLSPEAALGHAREALVEAATPRASKSLLVPCRLAGFVVDEAHVIEQWGRSFRPDFQRLSGLLDELRRLSSDVRALLLSATLTSSAREVVVQAYRGVGPWLEVRAGVPRYEADLFAHGYAGPEARDAALAALIDQMPRPAIIYATEVAVAETIHARLAQMGGYRRIALFTGDTPGSRRQEIVNAWAADEIDLVVATSAFGLGVDKAGVRAVVHACLPESSARYYQEVGRAARDGHQALAVALWTHGPAQSNDQTIASGLASKSWLTIETAMKRWQAILDAAQHDDLSWSTDGSARVLRVSLHAAHEGVEHGDSDYNEGWNETLLTLLQRAGALRVLSSATGAVPDSAPAWTVEVIDAGLLQAPDPSAVLWQRFETVRNAEQRGSVVDQRRLAALLEGKGEACLLTGVFEAVDPDAIGAPDCGRCPSCRRRSVRPPTEIPVRIAAAHWLEGPEPATGGEPPGLHLVTGATDGRRILDWLGPIAAFGVAQFLVPGDLAREVASHLAALAAPLGFVTAWPGFGEAAPDLSDLPTAFMPPPDLPPALWFDLVRRSCAERPRHPHYLLVRAGLRFDGRPLGQVASIHPPRLIEDVAATARISMPEATTG